MNKKEYEDIRMMQELHFGSLCFEARIDHITLQEAYVIAA